MIKCDNGTFSIKGDTNLLFAEFELIFIDVFSTMCKKEGFEETLKIYTGILEIFSKTIDEYKENPESDFVQLKIKTSKECIETNTFEISKGLSKVYFSNDEFEAMKTYNTKLCEGAVSEILSGYIEPSPMRTGDEGSLPCRYCEFAGFCGLEYSKRKDGRKCQDKVTAESFKENKEGALDGQQ